RSPSIAGDGPTRYRLRRTSRCDWTPALSSARDALDHPDRPDPASGNHTFTPHCPSSTDLLELGTHARPLVLANHHDVKQSFTAVGDRQQRRCLGALMPWHLPRASRVEELRHDRAVVGDHRLGCLALWRYVHVKSRPVGGSRPRGLELLRLHDQQRTSTGRRQRGSTSLYSDLGNFAVMCPAPNMTVWSAFPGELNSHPPQVAQDGRHLPTEQRGRSAP